MSLMDTASQMQPSMLPGGGSTAPDDGDGPDEGNGPDNSDPISDQEIMTMQQKIAAGVPQPMVNALQRVVTAGQKVLYDPKTADMLKEDLQGNQPVDKMLVGAAGGLMSLLRSQSNGTMPPAVIVPGGSILLLDIAKTMVQAQMPLTEQNVRDALDQFSALIMAHSGASPEQTQQVVGGQPPAAGAAPGGPPGGQPMPAQPPQPGAQP